LARSDASWPLVYPRYFELYTNFFNLEFNPNFKNVRIIRTDKHDEDEAIESQNRVVTAAVSHSESPGLITRPRHRLCLQRYFMVFLRTLKHVPGKCLKLGHDHVLSNSSYH
jgi:hypothetical protein